MKRILLLGLMASLLAVNVGCGIFCGCPGGPYGICDPTHCGPCGPPACGPVGGPCDVGCGPACGPCEPPCDVGCGPACGPSCDPGCDLPCGPPCGPCEPACGPCCGRYDPLGGIGYCLSRLFGPYSWCGPSCGEVYWGDFHGDPPDCCDPCNRCGQYSGTWDPSYPCGCGGGPSCGSDCGPGGVVMEGASYGVASSDCGCGSAAPSYSPTPADGEVITSTEGQMISPAPGRQPAHPPTRTQ